MDALVIEPLLRAVRGRLWRNHFITAARHALWASAGFMLVIAAVHLAGPAVAVAHVMLAIAVLWIVAIGWAALRRPSDAVCALWADRYLDGASAFTTVLEVRRAGETRPSDAVRWLEQCVNATVPHALRLLRARRDRARLLRPFVCMLISAALAALFLQLSGSPAPSSAMRAAPVSGGAERQASERVAVGSRSIETELASALQGTDARHQTEPRSNAGETLSAAAGKGKESAAHEMGERHRTASVGAADAGAQMPASGIIERSQSSGRTAASSTASGREAGDSRDERTDTALSHAQTGSLAAQGRDSTTRPPRTEKQADMGQLATFDDQHAGQRGESASPAPRGAPATPPAAANTLRLTPAEAAYVETWIKTRGER